MKNALRTRPYRNPFRPGRIRFQSVSLGQYRGNCRLLLLNALILAACALFVPACQEPAPEIPDRPLPATVFVADLVPEATRIINAALGSPDPGFRVNAIEVVATTGQIRIMPTVQRLLKDTNVRVKFAAASAIGDIQYSLAQEDLMQLFYDQDQNVRIAAAYAMTRLGSKESYDILQKSIASSDQVVRANAAMLLGKTGRKGALRYLWWTLGREDSNQNVRLQAAESIAMLGDERIFAQLWATVLSAYADDRIIGIKAMGALATPKAKEVLITKLDDDILEVRLAAAEQLGRLGNTSGEPEVLEVFTKNLTSKMQAREIERARVLTALAIGQICTPRLTRMLPNLLSDQSQAVRIAAAKAVFMCSKGPAHQKPPI